MVYTSLDLLQLCVDRTLFEFALSILYLYRKLFETRLKLSEIDLIVWFHIF